LTGSFDYYLASIEKKQRRDPTQMRRAQESEAPVRFYVVEDAATLETEIDAFFQLMEHDPSKANFLTPSMGAMRSMIRNRVRSRLSPAGVF